MPKEMKKKKHRNLVWRIIFSVMTILGGLNLLLFPTAWLIADVFGGISFSVTRGASIGVIGGADGPTSVFVTSSTGPIWQFLLWAILTAFGVYGLLWCRKQRKGGA